MHFGVLFLGRNLKYCRHFSPNPLQKSLGCTALTHTRASLHQDRGTDVPAGHQPAVGLLLAGGQGTEPWLSHCIHPQHLFTVSYQFADCLINLETPAGLTLVAQAEELRVPLPARGRAVC